MATTFTIVFVAALLLSMAAKCWLALRQIRHVGAHANAVPPQFAGRVSLDAHRKAAAYNIEHQRLHLLELAAGNAALVALTLLGGLQAIADGLSGWLGNGLLWQIGIVVAVVIVLAAIDLPFAWFKQFHVEAKFGFNRMTRRLFIADLVRSALVAAALGLPLVAVVLWLMARAGDLWWLYAWFVWIAFNALVLVLFPTVIAPMFNRFQPLEDESLVARVQALLARTGFASNGVFVMDGSRRSSHGNAYFTGMGRAKRIVFFDTLIERLLPQEIEAVLAHELGHFKLRHVTKRMALSFFASLALLALLGWLAREPWFYAGLGVEPAPGARNDALALVLFVLVLPVFSFAFSPIAAMLSRRHEFQADEFAARHTSAHDLANALVKLYEDNAATLTPDPLHSAVYDSHPPAATRVARLLAGTTTAPAVP